MRKDREGMYKSKIDKERKILYVELEDVFNQDDTLEAAKDFWVKMATLGKGSFIVCDISRLQSGPRSSRIMLQRIMKLIDSYEPQAIFRVVDAYSAAMVFERAYKNAGTNYKVYRVDSKEIAEEMIRSINNIPLVFKQLPSVN
nr:MAG: hypothetical protein IPM71_11710 [Bacteroidota bacterium]